MDSKHHSMTLDAFYEAFGTREKCIDFLSNVKWRNGFTCIRCQHTKYCKGYRPGDRQCTRCRKIESVKSGTLFHKIKIPLEKAFLMAYMIATDKKGAPSTDLARKTGFQQKTCWLFRMKVLQAMESSNRHPLEGYVDVKKLFIKTYQFDAKGVKTIKKKSVFIAVEKKNGGAARIYAHSGHKSMRQDFKAFIDQKIDKQALINSNVCGRNVLKDKCLLKPVKENEKIKLKILDRVIDGFKTWINSRHGKVTYLHNYLNEYCYRHNRHRMKGEIVEDLLVRMIRHCPRPYKEIITYLPTSGFTSTQPPTRMPPARTV